LIYVALSGCSLNVTSAPTADAGLAIQGKVFGGQQPIAGAQVYLFAANTGVFTPNANGYGNASVSLLNSATGTTLDTSGGPTNGDYYVTTGTGGAFSITSDYTCTANTQVYVYALGGNSGSGTNTASGLMAVLGNCPSGGNFLAATPFIAVNEVSTIAAAFALAGFATDATHVSSSGTALAQIGIQNAFANAANLADIPTATALATIPAGNGTVPQATINTLADILAACVNSTGAVTATPTPTACYTLFTSALSGGTTGSQPTDTATAAINIAHNPGANITTLCGLQTATPPFLPDLSFTGLGYPTDFNLAIAFTGGGYANNNGGVVAIDGSGNAWVANIFGSTLSEFSPLGAALSGTNGYTGGGLSGPAAIAIDLLGNVWTANTGDNSISKFSSTGTAISGTNGYTGGGLFQAYSIAVDASDNIWLADGSAVAKFSNAGVAISPAGAYSGGRH
jgi:hypothetical protein